MTGEDLDRLRADYAELDAELDDVERYVRQRREGNRVILGVAIGVPLGAALWVGGAWLVGRLAGWW